MEFMHSSIWLQMPSKMFIHVRRATVVAVALLVMAGIPPAVQAAHPKVERYSKAPEAEKISINLLHLGLEVLTEGLSFAGAAANMGVETTDSGVMLDIVVNHLDPSVEKKFELPGVTVRHFSPEYNRVSVDIDDPSLLYELARIPEVRRISPEYGGATGVGAVTSRAAKALKADIARTTFSVDGTGQKVGVLSDSFARTSGVRDADTNPPLGVPGMLTGTKPQDSGDLPPTVDLRRDDADGKDEGAAMAELVHDLAPGAAIAFHTAFGGGEAVFADGIDDLCTTAGATVVVDDIIIFAEPMYQDGIVAQAAARCVAAGVPYFGIAHNQANRGFRKTFVDIAAPDDRVSDPGPSGNDLHDWGGGDGFLDVTLPPGASITAILQWNQPNDKVSPGAGAQIDLDLYAFPLPNAFGLLTPIESSIEVQGVTGAPRGDAFELIQVDNPRPTPLTFWIAVEHFDGSQGMIPQDAATPLEFRLVFFTSSGTTIQGIPDGTSASGGPTIYGHVIAPGITSVAAVPWFDTDSFDPTFPPTAQTDAESASGLGGSLTVQFDTSGAFAPRTSFEPDISAVDDNNTTFFIPGRDIDLGGFEGEPDGFPNFLGTSAAAPNAAAVAALMRQANPTLTPAELNAVLENTAIDIIGSRAAVGDDDVTGIGLIDANAALASLALQFTLTVTKTGTGSGTVTSSPAGINCGADCSEMSEMYDSGTVVTLTATPDAGSVFAGWSGGGCAGTGTCTVTMNADTAVTAGFEVSPLPLLDVDGNGTADFNDGVVILRFLFGYRGATLTQGVDPNGTRTTPEDIVDFLEPLRTTMLDVDCNGRADALTDGVLIVRFLLGFEGDTLTVGAVDPRGCRSTAGAIAEFLEGFLPR